MNRPSFSILIPNFNDSSTLTHCLNSVINQSVSPDQIIFVDDGSTDSSVEIASTILAKEKNVKILQSDKNTGTVNAINRGLKESTTDYILFLSANDFVLPNLIDRARDSMKWFPKVGIWSAMSYFSLKFEATKKVYRSAIISMDIRYFNALECAQIATSIGSWFTGSTMFFNRQELLKIGGLRPAYGGLADLFAAYRLSSDSGAVFSPEPLACFTQHSDGFLSRTLSSNQAEASLEDFHKELERVKSPLANPEFKKRNFARVRFAFHCVKFEAKSGLSQLKVARFLNRVFLLLRLRAFDIYPYLKFRFFRSLLLKYRSV